MLSRDRTDARNAEIVGLLDIGTSKVVCVIAALDRPERAGEPRSARVLGIGHQQSRGLKAGVITDLGDAEASVRTLTLAAKAITTPMAISRPTIPSIQRSTVHHHMPMGERSERAKAWACRWGAEARLWSGVAAVIAKLLPRFRERGTTKWWRGRCPIRGFSASARPQRPLRQLRYHLPRTLPLRGRS